MAPTLREISAPGLKELSGFVEARSADGFLQPLGEGRTFPAVHDAGAPAQVVRMGAGHLHGGQANQGAVFQPGCPQLQADQANAQALGGGIAQQADVVEARAVGGFGPVQVMGGKPGAPGLQRAAQQGGVAQVLGLTSSNTPLVVLDGSVVLTPFSSTRQLLA